MATCNVFFTNDPTTTQAGDTLEVVYNWWDVPGNAQHRSAYLFLYEPDTYSYVWSLIIKNTPTGSYTYTHPNVIEGTYLAEIVIYIGGSISTVEETFEVQPSTATCTDYTNQTECEANGCYWWDNSCHDSPAPTADLCTWCQDNWLPSLALSPNLSMDDVFSLTDSYLSIDDIILLIDGYFYQTPPSGYDFIPNIIEVFGVVDYFLGIDGDACTGCDMIV